MRNDGYFFFFFFFLKASIFIWVPENLLIHGGRWVEHDPMEILESVRVCITKAVDKATADGFNVDKGLKAIGVTNQRETTLVWSKSTGCPLYNAIVWMDARTTSVCRYSFDPFRFGSFLCDVV